MIMSIILCLVGQTALYLGKEIQDAGEPHTYHTRYEEYLHHFKLYEAGFRRISGAALSECGRCFSICVQV